MLPYTLVVFLIFNPNFCYVISAYLDNNETTLQRSIRSTYDGKGIPKCCLENQVVKKNGTFGCIDYNTASLRFNIPIYDKNIHDHQIFKSFSDIFYVDMRADEKTLNKYEALSESQVSFYLNEERILYLKNKDAKDKWTPLEVNQYCVDYIIKKDGNLTKTFKFLINNTPQNPNLLLIVALYISCGFLFLVLIVYSLLPTLRNLTGLVLMAYVFSQLFTFLFVALMQNKHKSGTCVSLTVTMYFFNFATFCWMNVMSVDIWWTFRGYAKARSIHRRGETFKFLMYCLYGFGVPLVMTIGFVVIHNTNMDHIPWFVKPLGKSECFMTGKRRKLYLDLPMLILILLNWIFFLMTAFNIWRLHRATAVLDSKAAGTPAAHRSQRQRLCIYLKLSIIMGISWILEVVSSLVPELAQVWHVTDAYNLLTGAVIYIIFVCNRNVFSLLKTRFNQTKTKRKNKQNSFNTTSFNSKSVNSLSEPERYV